MLPVDRVAVGDVKQPPRDRRNRWRWRRRYFRVVHRPSTWRGRVSSNIPAGGGRLPPVLHIGQAFQPSEQSFTRPVPLPSQQAGRRPHRFFSSAARLNRVPQTLEKAAKTPQSAKHSSHRLSVRSREDPATGPRTCRPRSAGCKVSGLTSNFAESSRTGKTTGCRSAGVCRAARERAVLVTVCDGVQDRSVIREVGPDGSGTPGEVETRRFAAFRCRIPAAHDARGAEPCLYSAEVANVRLRSVARHDRCRDRQCNQNYYCGDDPKGASRPARGVCRHGRVDLHRADGMTSAAMCTRSRLLTH